LYPLRQAEFAYIFPNCQFYVKDKKQQAGRNEEEGWAKQLSRYKPSLNTSNFITKTSNVQVQKMMNQTIRAFEIC